MSSKSKMKPKRKSGNVAKAKMPNQKSRIKTLNVSKEELFNEGYKDEHGEIKPIREVIIDTIKREKKALDKCTFKRDVRFRVRDVYQHLINEEGSSWEAECKIQKQVLKDLHEFVDAAIMVIKGLEYKDLNFKLDILADGTQVPHVDFQFKPDVYTKDLEYDEVTGAYIEESIKAYNAEIINQANLLNACED